MRRTSLRSAVRSFASAGSTDWATESTEWGAVPRHLCGLSVDAVVELV